MNDMSSFQWQVRGGRVVAVHEGNVIYPTAEEVFKAVFGPGKEFRGIPFELRPNEDLPQLTFSRFPAPIAVRLYEDVQNIHLKLGAFVAQAFQEIDEVQDQLISETSWFPIHRNEISLANQWIANLGLNKERPISISDLLKLRLDSNCPVKLIDDVVLDSSGLVAKFGAEVGPIEGLRGELYPYQREGVRFLSAIAREGIGCILADEMGLGKTLQIIALAQLENNSGRSPILVISPATLLENWRREFANFAPLLRVNIHAGPNRVGIARRFRDWDVTVTSYETAVKDELLITDVLWNLVVLDEAQSIKNPDAERTRVAKSLRRLTSVAVTGTPVENRLTDLWSLTDFALPGLLGSLDAFRFRVDDRIEDASALSPLVAPLILRRRVIEVAADLPEKIEIRQALNLTQTQAEAYDKVRLDALRDFGAAGGLVSIAKLRAYCAHADESSFGLASGMEKFLRIEELLDEIFSLNEKALIFCSFTQTTDNLIAVLRRRFPGAYIDFIDGRVAVPGRQAIVDALFSHQGPGCLVLNPKAAGTGLNITTANHVIHFNPEWNPALTDQASARAHRRKQTRPVTVHHLFYADTVEEIMVDRANQKRELAVVAVAGHDGDSDPVCIAKALQMSPFRTSELTND